MGSQVSQTSRRDGDRESWAKASKARIPSSSQTSLAGASWQGSETKFDLSSILEVFIHFYLRFGWPSLLSVYTRCGNLPD